MAQHEDTHYYLKIWTKRKYSAILRRGICHKLHRVSGKEVLRGLFNEEKENKRKKKVILSIPFVVQGNIDSRKY